MTTRWILWASTSIRDLKRKQGLTYVQVLSNIFSAAVFCPREAFIWSQSFLQCKIKTQIPFLCELQYLAHLAQKTQKDLEAALFVFLNQINIFFVSVHF